MQHFKMILYGEPGVGKSVFALGTPKPFFITTDGNYSWLSRFKGYKEENHIQVHSWKEAKEIMSKSFEGYETIVVDLIDDLFKWCESEYCKRNQIEHVSDAGYGKGYGITRDEFIVELSKLLGREDKNILFISHAVTTVEKDRRGVEKTHYLPSDRIPATVWDQLEGRVRFFLRCFLEEEIIKNEETGEEEVINSRFLSLIKKPEERYSVIRNVDETSIPRYIELSYKTFATVVGLDKEIIASEDPTSKTKKAKVSSEKVEKGKVIIPKVEVKKESDTKISIKATPKEEVEEPTPKKVIEIEGEAPVVAQPKVESGKDKIAMMKAKLAALKAAQKKEA